MKTLRSRAHRALQSILIQFRKEARPTPKELAARPKHGKHEPWLSQRELGARIKVAQSFIWKVENGERGITMVECAAWARGCDRTARELFNFYADALERRP